MRVEETSSEDTFNVFGRGILHLSILIETMRREGYEFQVGKPKVLLKTIDGVKCEPYETLSVDVPGESSGRAIELVTIRKGEMTVIEPKGDLPTWSLTYHRADYRPAKQHAHGNIG
jgi:GTP-binding protein